MVARPEPEVEAMDAELAVAPPGCSHLGSFKVDNWKQNLRAIYQCFVWSGTAEARKRKVSPSPAPFSGLGCGECRWEWERRSLVVWGGSRGSQALRGGREGKLRCAGEGQRKGQDEASRCEEGAKGSILVRGGKGKPRGVGRGLEEAS